MAFRREIKFAWALLAALLMVAPSLAQNTDIIITLGVEEYMQDVFHEELLAEFEAFMQEDMVLTESVQQGYASGAYTPGPVNGLETRIIHQQKLIDDAITAYLRETPEEI